MSIMFQMFKLVGFSVSKQMKQNEMKRTARVQVWEKSILMVQKKAYYRDGRDIL